MVNKFKIDMIYFLCNTFLVVLGGIYTTLRDLLTPLKLFKYKIIFFIYLDVCVGLALYYYIPEGGFWLTFTSFGSPTFSKVPNGVDGKLSRNEEEYILFKQLMEKSKLLLSGLITVKGGRGLIKYGLYLYRLTFVKAPSKSSVKVLKYFFRSCYDIQKLSGLGHLVKYLKTCSVLLQQYCSRNTDVFGGHQVGGVAVAKTRRGLPRIIPRQQRELIRKGDPLVIKFWLSLFNLYRYLKCSYGEPSFDTVTTPGDFEFTEEIEDEIKVFWARLAHYLPKVVDRVPERGSPFLTEKVSVAITEADGVTGTSYYAIVRSLWTWRFLAWKFSTRKYSSRYYNRIGQLVKSMGILSKKFFPEFITLVEGMEPRGDMSALDLLTYVVPPRPSAFTSLPVWKKKVSNLGRLVSLFEAAGKIRTIAIVDPMTQWVLKPIHDWIFSILRDIPQDGTFAQDRPIKDLMSKKAPFIGSCDMSAATDRLPVKLQSALIGHLLGDDISEAWRKVLTYRDYYSQGTGYLYSVGQPMGALSSWASLALIHHFLFQWAASRAGLPKDRWFTDYAVLGDDSACSNRKVVDAYLVICKEIGVKVNLSKSLLSRNGSLEFAKRFMTPRGDCSPISFGEIMVGMVNFSTLSNWPRKRPIRIADLLTMMGYRHRTLSIVNRPWDSLPKKVKNMLIVLLSPWGPMKSCSLLDWLRLNGISRHNTIIPDYAVATRLVSLGRALENKTWDEIVQARSFEDLRFKVPNPDRPPLFPSVPKGPASRLAESVRLEDPSTVLAVRHCIYNPLRSKNLHIKYEVLFNIQEFITLVCSRFFVWYDQELNILWSEFLKIEELAFSVPKSTDIQHKTRPSVVPSAKITVKLFNSFLRPLDVIPDSKVPKNAYYRWQIYEKFVVDNFVKRDSNQRTLDAILRRLPKL